MVSGEARWVAVGGVGSVLTGAAVAAHPLAGLAVVSAVVGIPLLAISARVRFATVLIGALLVFQSSQEVHPTKLAYIALATVSVVISTVRVLKVGDELARWFWPLVPAAALATVTLAVSLVVAQTNGVPIHDWVRDVLPYVLLVTLPMVGLDAANEIGPRWLEGLLGALGVVGAVAVALDWLTRREVSTLGVGRVFLATTVLVALGFALVITRAGLGPRRGWWLAAALVILVAMLLSGSRTNLALLAGFLGVVGSRRKARINIMRISTAVAVTCTGAVFLLPWLAARTVSDPHFLAERIRRAQLVLTGQATKDLSYAARQQQNAWVADQFHAHPWLGTGPGYRYPDGGFSQDTPLVVPAKLGLVGLAVIVAYLLVVAVCLRRCRKMTGYLPIHTVARGWAVILVGLVPLWPVLEDKGLALGVTVLIAAVAARTRQGTAPASELEPPPLVAAASTP